MKYSTPNGVQFSFVLSYYQYLAPLELFKRREKNFLTPLGVISW